MCFSKWISATVAIAFLAGTAMAADTITAGKVKSVNAENKTFVLTDTADKDHTFKLGDSFVVNRAGKESKNALEAGDAVQVSYDKGPSNWTAHYILVRDGTSKNCQLIHGTFKGYDADRKELSFTDDNGKNSTYSLGNAMVRLNMEDTKIENVKPGEPVLIIVDMVETKPTLRSVMVQRRAERDVNLPK